MYLTDYRERTQGCNYQTGTRIIQKVTGLEVPDFEALCSPWFI